MTILALVLFAAAPQEDAAIARWIEELGEESLETREAAMAELFKAGKAALPRLEKARKHANLEIRGRAELVLVRLAKWERTRRFEPGPSLITLKRDDAPLGEVLAAIAKQTRTRITYEDAPHGDQVSVAFDRTPLFAAIDAICRRHGGIDYAFSCGHGEGEVVLRKSRYAGCPKAFDGPYEVRLSAVRLRKEYDFKGGHSPCTQLEFEWGWEKGVRHVGGSLRFEEVRDDLGNAYSFSTVKGPEADFEEQGVQLSSGSSVPVIPPDGATKLAVIRGSFDVVFPDDEESALFELPATKIGEMRVAGSWQCKLLSYAPSPKSATARLEILPGDAYRHVQIVLVDRDGVEHSLRGSSASIGREKADVRVDFEFPETAPIASLRLSRLVGSRVRRIPFEFRDVRVR